MRSADIVHTSTTNWLCRRPRLIDRTEAIELLEEEFPRLDLKHYRNLWDPALDLSDMLSSISCQDEVIDAVIACSTVMTARATPDAGSRPEVLGRRRGVRMSADYSPTVGFRRSGCAAGPPCGG